MRRGLVFSAVAIALVVTGCARYLEVRDTSQDGGLEFATSPHAFESTRADIEARGAVLQGVVEERQNCLVVVRHEESVATETVPIFQEHESLALGLRVGDTVEFGGAFTEVLHDAAVPAGCAGINEFFILEGDQRLLNQG